MFVWKTNKLKFAKEMLCLVSDLNGSSEDSCDWLSCPKRDYFYQQSCLFFLLQMFNSLHSGQVVKNESNSDLTGMKELKLVHPTVLLQS